MKNPSKARHGEPKYKCQLCDYKSHQKHQLDAHMRKHNGEKTFQCEICDYSSGKVLVVRNQSTICTHQLYTSYLVQKHLWLQHQRTHEKPFKCDFCDYRGTKDSLLEIHIRQVHTMERPYKCDRCDFAGASKDSLRTHSRIHITELNFTCSQCSSSFKTKG